MRRFSLALAAVATIALGATAASAADLGQRPVYKAQPALVVAAYNWSGFYIGGHLGYGWSKTDVHDLVTGASGSADPSGFLAGGQIGFNWQTGAFVFGIEGDGSWTNAERLEDLFQRRGHDDGAQLVRDADGPRRLRGRQLALVRQGRRRLVRR